MPFYFYDEFMKHNGLYEDISEMLADPGFPERLRHQGGRAEEAAQEDQEGRDSGVDRNRADDDARLVPRGDVFALPVQHQQRGPAQLQRRGTV